MRDQTFVTSPMRRMKRVTVTKRKRDAGRQSDHLDSCTQNSSPPSCRVHIKRGQCDRGEAHRLQSSTSRQRTEGCSHRTLLRTACTAASASCRTAPAEARSDGEDRSLASGLCARIGRVSSTTMGPQYRRLAIHDSGPIYSNP